MMTSWGPWLFVATVAGGSAWVAFTQGEAAEAHRQAAVLSLRALQEQVDLLQRDVGQLRQWREETAERVRELQREFQAKRDPFVPPAPGVR